MKTEKARSIGASTVIDARTAVSAVRVLIGSSLSLGGPLERSQRAVPEPVQVVAQLRDALRVELVDAAGADRFVGDQARRP